jgi:hypothetical protein
VIEVSAEQHQYDIYIAGSYEAAKEICAEFCEDGFCVSVAPVCFVYKYGREDGVRVTLINYARFPLSATELSAKARALADRLLIGLRQGSFSIVGGGKSVFVSRR